MRYVILLLAAALVLIVPLGCKSLPPYVSFLIKENKLKEIPFRKAPFQTLPKKWRSDRVTYAWLGHATVLINLYGTVVITDPVLMNRMGPPEWCNNALGIRRITKLPLKIEDLPPIDIILISHGHFDHLCLPSLRAILGNQKKKPLIVMPRGASFLVKDLTFQTVRELRWNRRITGAPGVSIKAFRVEHYGYVPYKNRKKHTGFNGYLLESHGKRVAFFGDTSYRRYRTSKGYWRKKPRSVNWKGQVNPSGRPMDLCIIPIGDSYYYQNHIGPGDALTVCSLVKGRKMLPIHYDTFILSPRDKYPKDPRKLLLRIALKRGKENLLLHHRAEGGLLFPDVGLTCLLKD